MIRRHEIQRLTGLFTQVRTERTGRVVLVSGPVASGRTTVVTALADHAGAAGGHVVGVNACEAERDVRAGLLEQLHRLRPHPDLRAPEAHDSVPRALFDALARATAEGAVLLYVDDVHLADEGSARTLAYLAHRLRELPVLLVLTSAVDAVHRMTHLVGTIERFPHYRRVSLELLRPDAIARALAQLVGPSAGEELTAETCAITGGNVLVLCGLIEDVASGGTFTPAAIRSHLRPGRATYESVLSCLRRVDHLGLDVAQALAVASRPGTPDILPEVAGLAADRTAAIVRALHLTGLLDAGGFRHPVIRDVVLDSMAPDRLRDLHRRAAAALHARRADPEPIAGHLLAADECPRPWGAAPVHGAAELALTAGDTTTALRCLTLVSRTGALYDDPGTFVSLATRMEWWNDRVYAESCLDLLATALREGLPDAACALRALRHLLAHGRMTEAERAVTRLRQSVAERPAEAAALGRRLRSLHVSYPTLAAGSADEDAPLHRPGHRRARGPAADDRLITSAAEILRGACGAEAEPEPIEAALVSLVCRERLDLAVPWCLSLIEDAERRDDSRSRALLLGLWSDLAVRTSDFRGAVAAAEAALADVPRGMWGVRIGLPLAGGVLGLLALGDLPAARRLLGTAHPPAMLRTRYGLAYLQAQGFCDLAAGDGALALREFLACGELMTRWRMDNSALLPWRRHAAEALIALGEQEKARELLHTQIDFARGTSAVVHASSLRLLAGTLSPEHRRKPLEDAVRLLSRSRHAFEYAGALLALARHCHATGECARAERLLGLAGRLAEDLGTRPLRERIDAFAGEAGFVVAAGGGEQEHGPALSGAERRVAELVREGCTNREISERLFITQSTVGQHLTRIYRKMRVNRRADLVRRLQLVLAE